MRLRVKLLEVKTATERWANVEVKELDPAAIRMMLIEKGLEPLEIADGEVTVWKKNEDSIIPLDKIKPLNDLKYLTEVENEKARIAYFKNSNRNIRKNRSSNPLKIIWRNKILRWTLAGLTGVILSLLSYAVIVGTKNHSLSVNADKFTTVTLAEEYNQISINAEYKNDKELSQAADIESLTMKIEASENDSKEIDKKSLESTIAIVFRIRSKTPITDTGASVFLDSKGLIERDHPDELKSIGDPHFDRDGNCITSFLDIESFKSISAIWALMINGGTFTLVSQGINLKVEMPFYFTLPIWNKMKKEIMDNSNDDFKLLLHADSEDDK
jgi:hypothetical protein